MGGHIRGPVDICATDTCERYNIKENKWYEWLPMGSPRSHAAAVLVDHSIYILGGHWGRRSQPYKLDTVDTIHLVPPSPPTSSSPTHGGPSILSSIPTAEWCTCSQLRLPMPLVGHIASVFDEHHIIILGGAQYTRTTLSWIIDVRRTLAITAAAAGASVTAAAAATIHESAWVPTKTYLPLPALSEMQHVVI
jgi:hypothetical protein